MKMQWNGISDQIPHTVAFSSAETSNNFHYVRSTYWNTGGLGTELQKTKALETFDTTKGAVIGLAANTFKDLLGQLIPGFHQQFEKTAQEKPAGGVPGPSSSEVSANTH